MEQNKDQSGAAVRSEAVALTDADIVEIVRVAHADGRLGWLGFEKDNEGTYTIPVLSKCHFQLVRAVLAKVSARAADAPSEPSEPLYFVRMTKTDGWREASEAAYWTFSEVNRRILYQSRAADALDSQPTRPCQADSPSLEFRTLLEQCRMALADAVWRSTPPIAVLRKLYEQVDSALASSQPTDGGVRNG